MHHDPTDESNAPQNPLSHEPVPPTQTTQLRWPFGPTGFELRFGNNVTRIVVGAIAIPLILGIVVVGDWAFAAFVAAISTGALLEFYWLTEKIGYRPYKSLGVIFGLLLMAGYAFSIVTNDEIFARHMNFGEPFNGLDAAKASRALGILNAGGLLALTAMACLTLGLRGTREEALPRTLATLAGAAYVPTLMAMFLAVYTFVRTAVPPPGYPDSMRHELLLQTERAPKAEAALFIALIFAAIWICDSAAYFAGRAFGRHKLFERVSPKKTWEGAIAGAVFAVLTVLAFKLWVIEWLNVFDVLVIGLIVGIAGQVGDLAESYLKRSAGIKDSSQIIPGHGGLLDRFDSLLFVAPLTYVWLSVRTVF